MKKGIIFGAVILFFIALAQAQTQTIDANVCCEKTNSGLYCQNVPENQCNQAFRKAPTSCDSTSFCKPGVCYSPIEGTCMDNTPQIVCNAKNATWFEGRPAQCELGCCVIGDQAAFVSLVRCKRLASSFGMAVNYNKNIKDELSCLMSVRNEDKGACVYDFEFEKGCKFTTRANCNSGVNGTGKGTFYKDKLCTAPELGTICAKTTKTTCLPGKEEVYFLDSCGNPGNIYDAGKVNDILYWTNVVTPENSCNPKSSNANSKSCGNCNYLLGSICRAEKEGSDKNICVDLNCKDTSAGFKRHGESWCVYDDKGDASKGKNSVGSRFFKHVCINGKELVEPCADFRQEECIQDKIETTLGDFTQAACRANRWLECDSQTEKDDCENTDRRDCLWSNNKCIPKNPPGLKFWEGEEAKNICAKANTQCVVTYEKGITGGEKCVSGCECLTPAWAQRQLQTCNAMGDCGANINWLGVKGYKDSYKVVLG